MKFLKTISLSLILMLSACTDNKNAVNISIDESLLKNLAGAKAGNSTDSGTRTEQQPDENTVSEAPGNVQIQRETEQAIFQAIDDNANALNIQDINAFWATLHPQSEFISLMPDVFYLLTSQYQTRYNIVSKTVQSQSENAATVLVQRRTSDISGTINQDVLYTMRTDNGTWKIFFMTDQSNSF